MFDGGRVPGIIPASLLPICRSITGTDVGWAYPGEFGWGKADMTMQTKEIKNGSVLLPSCHTVAALSLAWLAKDSLQPTRPLTWWVRLAPQAPCDARVWRHPPPAALHQDGHDRSLDRRLQAPHLLSRLRYGEPPPL
eukprot:1074461-Rhodomonas_salina.1